LRDGSRTVLGTLYFDMDSGDSIILGSATKIGRPLIGYRDNVGGYGIWLLPEESHIILSAGATPATLYQKSLFEAWASDTEAKMWLQAILNGDRTVIDFGAAGEVSFRGDYMHATGEVHEVYFAARSDEASLVLLDEVVNRRLACTTYTGGIAGAPGYPGVTLVGDLYFGLGKVDPLPTPSATYRGKMIRTEGTGALGEDELWHCIWDGSAYAWKKVTLT